MVTSALTALGENLMMVSRLRWLAAGAIALGAGATLAQDAPLLDGLSDPEIRILAQPADPETRKATAIVNGDVITDTDIDHRLNLVLAANQGQIADDEKARLRLQVIRNLIDEKLQIQEAASKEVTIPQPEVDQAFGRVASNFKMNPTQFADYLRVRGTSPTSIKQQIHAELAWSRLLRRRVEPFINVGDDEVQALIDRLNAAKGSDEYRIAEIFLTATAENAEQVRENAQRIVDQVRGGASFIAYARQFSEASTAAVGGDLGWVRSAQLSDELQPVVESLPEGQVSNPIQIPGGFAIIALVDKRKVLAADPKDAVLAVKQITIPLPANVTQSAAEATVRQLNGELPSMGGCGGAEALAGRYGGTVVANDQVRLGNLPPALQEIMGKLQVGETTPPFGARDDGIRVLVLCGREDPPAAGAPSFDQLYAQMEENKIAMAARRYLRDLRRDAVIDYR
jgi:peptidyl-prolyl cis-trans isomerase SurA